MSELVYKGETALVDNYDDESLVTKLYNLLGIQYGTEEDQFNWVQKL